MFKEGIFFSHSEDICVLTFPELDDLVAILGYPSSEDDGNESNPLRYGGALRFI